MIPASPSPDPVVVHTRVDASPDEIQDAIDAFAEKYFLEVDYRHSGDEIRLVSRGDSENALFRRHDRIDIELVPQDDGYTGIVLVATMAGLHARGSAWQRREYVVGGLITIGLTTAGIAGILQGFSIGDLIPIGAAVLVGRGSVRKARGEFDSRDDFERRVAAALAGIADDLR